MSKKILVFGASNSKKSINKQFAVHTASQLENIEIQVVDLNDFELPIYSIDLEEQSGIPDNAVQFSELIKGSDGIIASFAEHNGLFTSAFKNLWDWMSRIEPGKIWHNKPMFLLSTSITRRPENFVLKIAKDLFPHFGVQIIASFYLPSFNHYFKENQITEPALAKDFETQLQAFQQFLTNQ